MCVFGRRGEEHSFILKPAATLWKHSKVHNDSSRPSRMTAGSPASSWHNSNIEGKHSVSPADQYAVLVSCRCNYTGMDPERVELSTVTWKRDPVSSYLYFVCVFRIEVVL